MPQASSAINNTIRIAPSSFQESPCFSCDAPAWAKSACTSFYPPGSVSNMLCSPLQPALPPPAASGPAALSPLLLQQPPALVLPSAPLQQRHQHHHVLLHLPNQLEGGLPLVEMQLWHQEKGHGCLACFADCCHQLYCCCHLPLMLLLLPVVKVVAMGLYSVFWHQQRHLHQLDLEHAAQAQVLVMSPELLYLLLLLLLWDHLA